MNTGVGANTSADLAGDTTTARDSAGLRRTLGTLRLACFVVAAVAPLAAVIGVLPVALVFGSGVALPFAFLAVSVVVALFAVGYSAISREIVTGGAFYTYIAHGLGRIVGLGAAAVAVFSYVAFVPGGISYLGFLLSTTAGDLVGVSVSWPWLSLAAWALAGWLGYRQVDISSRIVAVVIVVEMLLLLCINVGVWLKLGPRALPVESLDLGALVHGAPGVSILLAFTCYFGIESAALYSEESHAPEKSVSRATYVAIAFIGVFYCLTSWFMVGAIGPDNIASITADEVGTIYFRISDEFLSRSFTHVIQLAVSTSMLATVISIHNVAARYLFVLGRQRCLPSALGRVHPRRGSPHLASLFVSAVSLVVFVTCALLGIHPMVGLGLVALGLAAVGVLFMQMMTSVAVIAYFRRNAVLRPWSHMVAPALAALGIGIGLVISLRNFEYLSGSQNRFVNLLPISIAVVFLLGIGYALWLRRYRPDRYETVLSPPRC